MPFFSATQPPPAASRPARAILVLAPCLIVVLYCLAILVTSFQSKFDFTDEAIYIYYLSHPGLAGLLPIDNIVGWTGTLFDSNIIIWRRAGLAVLCAAATLFGLSIYDLARLLVPDRFLADDRAAMVVCSVIGVLFYYSIGPPTLSYNTTACAGLLAMSGAVVKAALAASKRQWLAWSILSSFAGAVMLASRPSIIAIYPILFMPLIWLIGRRLGWARVFKTGLLHIFLLALSGAFLIFAIVGTENFSEMVKMLTYGASTGSYQSSSIISEHLSNIWIAILQSVKIAAIAVASAAAIGTVAARSSTFASRKLAFWPAMSIVLACLAVPLPLIVLQDYWYAMPSFIRMAQTGCDYPLVACQGGSIVFGARLIHLVLAQILCLALIVVGDDIANRQPTGPQPNAAPGPVESLALLVLFLVMATVASSFYTNTGWFRHSIIGFAPMGLASYVALRGAHGHFSFGVYLPAVLLLVFAIIAAQFIMHNHIWFPYRVTGDLKAQTARLEQPPELAGVSIHPESVAIIKQTAAILTANDFHADKDVIVAAYAIPGLVVALGARALGSAWLYAGYPNIDNANCKLIARDQIDLSVPGRVFVLSTLPMSQLLRSCIAERGADFSAEIRLGFVPIRKGNGITVFVVPVRLQTSR